MKTETIDRHPRDAAKPDPTYSHPHLAPGWARLKEEYGADQPWQYSPKMEGLWSNYDYLPESALPRTRTIFEPGDPVEARHPIPCREGQGFSEWRTTKVSSVKDGRVVLEDGAMIPSSWTVDLLRPIPAEPAAPAPVAEPKVGDTRPRDAMEPKDQIFKPFKGERYWGLALEGANDFRGRINEWHLYTCEIDGCALNGINEHWYYLPATEPVIAIHLRREWWKDAPAEKAEEPTPAQGPSLPRFESAEEIEWALKGAWAVVRMTEERKVSDFADPLGAVQRYTAIKARIAELERALSDLAATGAGEGA